MEAPYARPMRCPVMSSTDVAYAGIALRACYAMSGTDMAHYGINLRACYARKSVTDLAYGSILSACYATPSTAIAYAAVCLFSYATRCPASLGSRYSTAPWTGSTLRAYYAL
eukprot:3941201-Rhodomonas_salina.8